MKKEILNKCIVNIYKDLVDGYMKWEIKDKFKKGFYDYTPTTDGKDEKEFDRAWNAMLEFFSLDNELTVNEQRDKMYARFLNIYRLNLQQDNLKEARLTLESLNKLLGLNQDNINMKIDEQVTIDFKIDEGSGNGEELSSD